MKYKLIKRFLLGTLIFLLFALIYSNYSIISTAKNYNFSSLNAVPRNKVGLLLGTSKTGRGGQKNQYFYNRIDAAAQLFNAQKIKYILVSGDNGSSDYNEPADMKNALIEVGIPETNIVLDYAGFSTYESVARAKYVFQCDSITIISQKFHNERAIYLAKNLGLSAVGFNAKDVTKAYGFKTKIREYFARVLAVKDAMFKPKPTYLGKVIPIGENKK
jgi:SanA protein